MLLIRREQIEQMVAGRLNSLAKRIDNWLREEGVCLACELESRRIEFIEETVELGTAVGLRFEIDYALFTYILLEHGEEWRSFIAEPEAQRVLKSQDWRSETRLRLLHALSLNRLNSIKIMEG